MYFSWSPRKVPKESDLRGRYENAPPLKIPLPHRQPVFKNVPIFEHLQPKNLESFLLVDTRKSEHFRVSDGVAAGGVHRGGRIFVAPPLCRLLLVLFLPVKKRTLLHLIATKRYILLQKERSFRRALSSLKFAGSNREGPTVCRPVPAFRSRIACLGIPT